MDYLKTPRGSHLKIPSHRKHRNSNKDLADDGKVILISADGYKREEKGPSE
jgi:hypothetical protein